MSQELKPYPFDNATIEITAAQIVPPIYRVTVTGYTQSLGAIVEVVNTGKVVENHVVLEVLGSDTDAIGTVEYSRSLDLQEKEGTAGVVVVGSNNKKTLPWS